MDLSLSEHEMRAYLYASRIDDLTEWEDISALQVIEREKKATENLEQLVERYQLGHRVHANYYHLTSHRFFLPDDPSDLMQIILTEMPDGCVGHLLVKSREIGGRKRTRIVFFLPRIGDDVEFRQMKLYETLVKLNEQWGALELSTEGMTITVDRVDEDNYCLVFWKCGETSSFVGPLLTTWKTILDLEAEYNQHFRVYWIGMDS